MAWKRRVRLKDKYNAGNMKGSVSMSNVPEKIGIFSISTYLTITCKASVDSAVMQSTALWHVIKQACETDIDVNENINRAIPFCVNAFEVSSGIKFSICAIRIQGQTVIDKIVQNSGKE
jgi:hypothetical protein